MFNTLNFKNAKFALKFNLDCVNIKIRTLTLKKSFLYNINNTSEEKYDS